MSMQKLKCPHCDYEVTVSVNDKIKMSLNNRVCSQCHKPYAWQGIYGKIKVIKK